MLAAKPEDLRSHMETDKERPNSHKVSSDFHKCVSTRVPTHIYTNAHVHVYNYNFKINLKNTNILDGQFNPGTWKAEAGGFLSPRPAWSIELVPV